MFKTGALRKATSLFMAMTLFLGTLSFAEAAGDGTADNPYQITTQVELAGINPATNAYYILMKDIELTGSWTPLGGGYDEYFRGNFDGNGHVIRNLQITGNTYTYAGLFGRIDSGKTVKNLTLENVAINVTSLHTGGVAGANLGTISNCIVKGDVVGTLSVVGGIAGANNGTVKNCAKIGGSVRGGKSIDKSLTGGIVGDNQGVVSACYNTGAVIGTADYVGGIAGESTVDANNSANAEIKNCYNTGAVFSTGSTVGGIVGINYITPGIIVYGALVSQCYNTGVVNGFDQVAGIAGSNGGLVSGCVSLADNMIADASATYYGQIVGFAYPNKQLNNYGCTFMKKNGSQTPWTSDYNEKDGHLLAIDSAYSLKFTVWRDNAGFVSDIWIVENGTIPALKNISLTASDMQFPNTGVGEPVAPQYFSITNVGNTEATVTGVTLYSQNFDATLTSTPADRVVPPNNGTNTQGIKITPSPQLAAGTYSERASIGYTDINGDRQTASVTITLTVVTLLEQTQPSAPLLQEASANAITLVGISGAEYSKDNGLTWQDNAQFENLKANTHYSFVARLKAKPGYKASPKSDTSALSTTRAQLDVNVTIMGTPAYGQTLYADVDLNLINVPQAGPYGVISYQWTQNGVGMTDAKENKYTLTAADIGKDINVMVGASNRGGVASAPQTLTVEKAEQAPPPLGFTVTGDYPVNGGTGKVVTITPVPGAEYKFFSMNDLSLANMPFGNINGHTLRNSDGSLSAHIRFSETATHKASSGVSVKIDEDYTQQNAPSSFTLTSVSDGSGRYTVSMPEIQHGEYSFDGVNYSDIWKKGSCTPGETITGHMRVKQRNETVNGSTIYYATSPVTVSTITLPLNKVEKPQATVDSGTYPTQQVVSFMSQTSDAKKHYTLDGSTPTAYSPLYCEPLVVSTTTTIKVLAVKAGMADSDIETFAYTIGAAPVSTITNVSVSPGTTTVNKGGTATFSAVVTGTNTPSQDVAWTVTGSGNPGTSITSGGALTIAQDETAAGLTVTATSVQDNTKFGTASVTVAPANPPIQTYTVAFHPNGGVRTSGGELTQTVSKGTSAVEPILTRSGYTFKGWDKPFNAVTTDMAITAQWTPNSGGGGPSSGGGATPPTSQQVSNVTGGDNPVKIAIKTDTKEGSASVELTSTQVAKGKDIVVAIPEIAGVRDYSLTLPAAGLSVDSGSGSVSLKTNAGNLTLPSNMLIGMDTAAGSKVQVSIGSVKVDDLPKHAQDKVGNHPVVSLSLTIDGKAKAWNNPNASVIVSIPYTPTAEELKNPDGLTAFYIDGSGNMIEIKDVKYDPLTKSIVFTTTHFSYYAVGYQTSALPKKFSDVLSDAWCYNAVAFIAEKGITTGTGNDKFSPEATLTRGQFIVMLMKAYDIEADKTPMDNFADAGNTYYTGYLAVAKAKGISSGMGDNKFAPNQPITRQEMFSLLYNALKVIGQIPQGDSGKTVSDFTDCDSIAPWATEPMTALIKAGTITGSGRTLNPTGTTTRAEMAQVLYNLLGK